MKKRILSILTALCLCLTLLPTAALADDAVTTEKALKDAVASGGTVKLGADITLSSTLTISGTVTLDLKGHVLALAPAEGGKGNGRVIQITETGDLTLIDTNPENRIHTFTVNDDGLWVLDETNGTKTVYGGVITGGTSGSAISDGGGVHNKGTFTMTNGAIVGNSSYNGGGVKNEGTFTMKGGQITGNTAVLSATNKGGFGGGVYSHAGQDTSASFTMNYGSITDNTAAVSGGGIHSSGTKNGSDPILATLTITGIYGTSGDRRINRNRAQNGGGIYADYTNVTLRSNSGISGNSATNCGGGIFIKNGSFTMTGGAISGNSASCENSGQGLGGGVYCGSGCTVIMAGGSITYNNANGKGGGVYCGGDSFTVATDASVTDNVKGGTVDADNKYYGGEDSNVYLPKNKTITVNGSLSEEFGVTTEQTAGYHETVTIATGSAALPGHFTSDNGLCSVERAYDGDKKAYVIQFVGKCAHGDLTVQDDGTYKCKTCEQTMVASLTSGETTTYYVDLADAILAAQKASGTPTVKVLKELTGDSGVGSSVSVQNSSLTLDLNGHSVDFASGNSLAITGGSVTITNSSTTNARINTVSTRTGAVVTVSGSTVGTLSGDGTAIVGTAEALTAAASGGVANIRLVNDITLSSTLSITDTVTLDLNGHSLTANVTVGEEAPEGQEGTTTGGKPGFLTIQDSSASGTGILTSSSGTTLAITVGTVTLRSGKVSSGNGSGDCAIKIGTGVPSCGFDPDGGQVDGSVAVSNGSSSIYASNGTSTGTVFTGNVSVASGAQLKGGKFYGTVTINGGGAVDNSSGQITNNGVFVFESGSNIMIDRNKKTPDAETVAGMKLSGTGYVQVENANTGGIEGITYQSYSHSGKSISPSNTVTVTFALGGGSFSGALFPEYKTGYYAQNGENVTTNSDGSAEVKVITGLSMPQPTDPTRDGYTFDGWYTAQTGGAKFDFNSAVTGNTTLYAKWTAIPTGTSSGGSSSAPTYSVTAPTAANGTVKSDRRTAEAGETVTLTVTPDKGYTLETLTVLDKNGKEIALTDLGNGKYSFKMPAGKVTVNATFMDDNTMLNFFVDVTADKYFYDAVLWAAKNGITGGIDENHFAPYASCTRGQLVTFLWRAAGCPVVDDPMSFTDVGDGYYTEAVRWAASLGIVGGYGNGLFGTGDTITRQQFVAILYRFAVAQGCDVSVGADTNILSYNDAFDVSEYAVEAFQWATGAGIVQGNDGNLMPQNPCTRAQIVTMLYRLLGK